METIKRKIYGLSTAELNEKCFAYILDAIPEPSEIAEGWNIKAETDAERLQFVLNTFRSEYRYNIERMGELNGFREWLLGLPSAINIEFRNYNIIEIAKAWGSIPQDATEKMEDKIIENWFNLIANKFFQLCKRNKVK